MGSVTELANYFNFSPKRQRALEKFIEDVCPQCKKKKLKDLCRTRYFQVYDVPIVETPLPPSKGCDEALTK